MNNSSLVQYTKISPFRNSPRKGPIKYIAIHCVVGQCVVESLGARFQDPAVEASSNYGIGYDGKVGMYVEEKDRSWCTSCDDDEYAVTIEVASDAYEPLAVTPAAYAKLLELVTDVCRRNGIKKLVWSTKKSDRVNHKNGCNMLAHRDYTTKSCPGTWLYSKMGEIAAEVNNRLGAQPETTSEPAPAPAAEIKAGDRVKITKGAKYTNGNTIPNVILAETWIVESVKGSSVLINKSVSGEWAINSRVNAKYLTVVGQEQKEEQKEPQKEFEPYIVRVEVDALNIRSAPSTLAKVVGTIRDRGAYTIVAEADGVGANRWGKLKSGAGWISLDYVRFVRKV